MKKFLYIIFLFIPFLLFSQDLSSYYKMIEKGDLDSVKVALSELQKKYPKSPEVLYLSGVIESDGERALLIFKDVFSQFPSSQRADDALLKIIEYLYTKGLYRKTVEYTKEMIRKYPESELLDRCVHLLLCSFNVMNKRDSVDYYFAYYTDLYPEINVNFQSYRCTPQFSLKESSVSESKPGPELSYKKPVSDVKTQKTLKKKISVGPKYSIQIGAFSVPSNAYALRDRLKSKGYDAFIQELKGTKRTLLAVKVGSFKNREEAKSFAERMKKKDKIDYVIVKQ